MLLHWYVFPSTLSFSKPELSFLPPWSDIYSISKPCISSLVIIFTRFSRDYIGSNRERGGDELNLINHLGISLVESHWLHLGVDFLLLQDCVMDFLFHLHFLNFSNWLKHISISSATFCISSWQFLCFLLHRPQIFCLTRLDCWSSDWKS